MFRLLSRIAPLLVGLPILVLLERHNLFAWSPLIIALQAAALVLNISARAAFSKGQFRVGAEPAAGLLLTRGPYRIIRHPMYAGALLFLWAAVLGHPSLFNASLGVIATAAAFIRMREEERRLGACYPEYSAYADRTKRLIPYLF